MDESLLERFGMRDLPRDDISGTTPNGLPLSLAISSVAQHFESMAKDIIEACPRSPDRTLALRSLLDARHYAIVSLLYPVEVAR